MRTVSFTVTGTPTPQGSKRAFVNRHTGRVALVESAGERVRTWREDVRSAARDACDVPSRAPVALVVTFLLQRPKSHYGTGRNADAIRASAPAVPTGKPDLDKLVRSLLDALTGVVFCDDSQVHRLIARKTWALHGPGAEIHASIYEDT